MNKHESLKRCPSGSFVYTIKSGDTLYKLAIRYNTTVEAIMRLNPGINPNNLQIGQQICMPGGGTGPGPGPRCPMGTFEYTIKSGDTIYKLAIRYNTTVEAILRVNPGIDPMNLRIGQKICIPESTPVPPKCPMGTFVYVIKTGDTIYKLAIEYNTTVEAILRVNPGIDPMNLQIGQRICIPEMTPPPVKCPKGTFVYLIKAGDTIYKLAVEYNTTVEAILKVNPGIDPMNLQIGQKICIPESTPVPPKCPMGTFEYTIKAGDTVYDLAKKYNTTVEAILRVNPGLNPDNLQIGQVICIPEGSPMPPCDGVYYIVRPGDTFYSIAMMFDITVARLMAANPGVDPANLRIGQRLCIPRVGPPPIPCPGGTLYEVKTTDNVVSILVRFNISVLDLVKANPKVDFDNLMPGQMLCIMPHKDWGCPCPRGTESYEIKKDDIPSGELTVIYLAKKFNISVEDLMKINPNLTPSDFVVGKMVCVPM